jgi:hypothetical protein
VDITAVDIQDTILGGIIQDIDRQLTRSTGRLTQSIAQASALELAALGLESATLDIIHQPIAPFTDRMVPEFTAPTVAMAGKRDHDSKLITEPIQIKILCASTSGKCRSFDAATTPMGEHQMSAPSPLPLRKWFIGLSANSTVLSP